MAAQQETGENLPCFPVDLDEEEREYVAYLSSQEQPKQRVGMSLVTNAAEITYDCAYCHQPKGCTAFCFWAYYLLPSHYEALVERGFQRSGNMVYLPMNDRCCCPQFSMRLDARLFRPNHKQQRVQRRMRDLHDGKWNPTLLWRTPEQYDELARRNAARKAAEAEADPAEVESGLAGMDKAVTDSDMSPEAARHDNAAATKRVDGHPPSSTSPLVPSSAAETKEHVEVRPESAVALYLQEALMSCLDADVARRIRAASETVVSYRRAKLSGSSSQHLQFYTAVPLKVAASNSKQDTSPLQFANHLCSALNIRFDQQKQHLVNVGLGKPLSLGRVKAHVAAPGFVNFEFKCVLKPHVKAVSQTSETDSRSPRRFKITSVFRDAVLNDETFGLYFRYQLFTHKDTPDKCTQKQFKEFLVDSPLIKQAPGDECPPCGLGSCFRHYFLESRPVAQSSPTAVDVAGGGPESWKRLVGIGVLDVMPHSLNSSYFFWDPAVAPLKLGTFSALEELAWVRLMERQRRLPSFHHYYIGYFVQRSARMQYKLNYKPSELYCPLSEQWVDTASALEQIKRCRYGPLLKTEEEKQTFESSSERRVGMDLVRKVLVVSGRWSGKFESVAALVAQEHAADVSESNDMGLEQADDEVCVTDAVESSHIAPIVAALDKYAYWVGVELSQAMGYVLAVKSLLPKPLPPPQQQPEAPAVETPDSDLSDGES